MSCPCPIIKLDFKPSTAGNNHTVHVTTPAELGDITAAEIWVTLRQYGAIVGRRRNVAAGGSNAEVLIVIAGGPTSAGAFDVLFPPGFTSSLHGKLDYQIDIVVGTFDQTIAIGTWCIALSIADRTA